MHNRTMSILTVAALAIASCIFTATTANAELLVYEGFQYGTAGADRSGSDLLHGQPDGSGGDINATGLGATWQDSTAVTATSDLFVASGSLSFGDLSTAGNHVRGDTNQNNDIFSRPVTTALDGFGEFWFSFLASKLQNNFSAAEGGVAITNQTVSSAQLQSITSPAGLEGFAISPDTAGNNWSGWAWDGTSRVDVGGTYGVPTDGSQTDLLIGQVSYGTGTGGTDEFSVYSYTLNAGSVVGGTLNQIGSTLEVNVDESALDTLNVTRQVNTAFDEIRIGTTLDDVLGLATAVVPEPSTFVLSAFGLLSLGMVGWRRRNK